MRAPSLPDESAQAILDDARHRAEAILDEARSRAESGSAWDVVVREMLAAYRAAIG